MLIFVLLVGFLISVRSRFFVKKINRLKIVPITSFTILLAFAAKGSKHTHTHTHTHTLALKSLCQCCLIHVFIRNVLEFTVTVFNILVVIAVLIRLIWKRDLAPVIGADKRI